MPVSVIVGGQFGSEGKGKIALDVAERRDAAAVVRVGGTNSGHTVIDNSGATRAFRQLPASGINSDTIAILPPGALIDIDIFLDEVDRQGRSEENVSVDPFATVIADADRQTERDSGLVKSIGSTGSGTGAALQRRISRMGDGKGVQAKNHPKLKPFLQDTTALIRRMLARNNRVVIEGSQGFGLSILHGGHYPNATSRDTTAAAFVAESGLSPLDVDEIVLVLRAFPIRVAGESGPLPQEITWEEVSRTADLPATFHEMTTASVSPNSTKHLCVAQSRQTTLPDRHEPR